MFETEFQRAAHQTLGTWLYELFANQVTALHDPPGFSVTVGSAVAYVSVTPWGDNDALVESSAQVVRSVELTEGLLRYLLRENRNRLFGAFSIDDNDDVWFQHNLIASTCQKNELEASILSVVQTADFYDDVIVDAYGGMRAIDEVPPVAERVGVDDEEPVATSGEEAAVPSR